MDTLASAVFEVPATDDPAIRLHVRNRHPAGVDRFGPDRIVLFVHGATYPAESAFDLDLPGGAWLDIAARRGFDAYCMRCAGLWTLDASRQRWRWHRQANPPFAGTDDAVRDVAAVVDFILDRRGVERIDLVGWSWGTTLMGGFTRAPQPQGPQAGAVRAAVARAGMRRPSAGQGADRRRTQAAARTRGVLGMPPERIEEILARRPWLERRRAADLATDPEGAAHATPPVVRSPNGVIQDLADCWMKGRPLYDPGQIRVPTLIVVGELGSATAPPSMAR
jgi:pimeloyl-ACP methyl ester carboxylesterase